MMPGIRDILELLGDIPRLGNLGYSTLAGNREPLTPEQEELLRRYGFIPEGGARDSASISVSSQAPYTSRSGYEDGGISYADMPPVPPRSMRMTLNGRDITDEEGALSGGFGLPRGTKRNGGGFSQGTMDDGSVPSRAGSLLSLAEGAAVNALQGNRGADATARSISELLYGGSQLEQSPTLNRLRAAEAAAQEKANSLSPTQDNGDRALALEVLRIAGGWDPLKSGPMPAYDDVLEAVRSGKAVAPIETGASAPTAAARQVGNTVAQGKYPPYQLDSGQIAYTNDGVEWWLSDGGKPTPGQLQVLRDEFRQKFGNR